MSTCYNARTLWKCATFCQCNCWKQLIFDSSSLLLIQTLLKYSWSNLPTLKSQSCNNNYTKMPPTHYTTWKTNDHLILSLPRVINVSISEIDNQHPIKSHKDFNCCFSAYPSPYHKRKEYWPHYRVDQNYTPVT